MSLAVAGSAAMLSCSFGLAPSTFVVLPGRSVIAEVMLMGNISDRIPLANIEPFGDCISLANPEVLAATIAAAGVLTPMPCIPVTPAPWFSAALNVLVQGMPALDQTSTLMCLWAGVIIVDLPGTETVIVP